MGPGRRRSARWGSGRLLSVLLAAALPGVADAQPTSTARHLDFRHVTHSNLGGAGPDAEGLPGIRYSNALVVAGQFVDLVVFVEGTATMYTPGDPNRNGRRGLFGQINVAAGSYVDLVFRFVDAITSQMVTVDQFTFSIYDIDAEERVTVGGFASYCKTSPSDVQCSGTAGRLTLTSNVPTNPADDPVTPATLTDLQSSRAVTLYFASTSQFPVRLEAAGPVGATGREFLFSGIPINCTKPIAKPFDCQAGLDTWQTTWTDQKKQWCCQNERVCPTLPPPAPGPSPWIPPPSPPPPTWAPPTPAPAPTPTVWAVPPPAPTWKPAAPLPPAPLPPAPLPAAPLPAPAPAPAMPWPLPAEDVKVVVIDDVVEMPPIASCRGKEREWAECMMPQCENCNPRDCLFSEWNDWTVMGGCTGLCTRQRSIMRQNNECGEPCGGVTIETTDRSDCMPEACKVVVQDCLWEAWTEWTPCSRRHRGQSYRLRKIAQRPLRGGAPCMGSFNMTRPCGGERVDCQMGDWGEWTACSCTCGGGLTSRMRRVVQPASGDGRPCEGITKESAPCASGPCPTAAVQPCRLSDWGEWQGCEVPGGRQQMRQREIQESDELGVGICNEPLVETVGCPLITEPQPQPCVISDWSDWSYCKDNCQGHRTRFRSVVEDTTGVGCFLSEGDGQVDMHETSSCECRHEPCELSEWSEWGDCSHRCGPGITVRERRVHGGHDCLATLQEVKMCQREPCRPLDCVWADWDEWSTCTCTCGGGTTRRSRVVKQAPRHGGRLCEPEQKTQVAPCNVMPCERCIDGQWGPWAEWSKCTATCAPALRVRHRYMARFANRCGRPATGLEDEYEVCSGLRNCEQDQDCELSEWGDWSGCSSECFGVRERSRRVAKTAIGAGKPCQGLVKEISPCNPAPGETPSSTCAPDTKVPCKMSAWDEWHPCTASCDGGQRLRYRQVLAPNREKGRPCEAELAEVAPCGTQPCESTQCKDCLWGAWSEWGDCSACGNQRFRHRAIERMPNGCGKICDPGAAKELGTCSSPCQKERYCVWTSWSTVTECKTECGYGTSVRQRDLTASKHVPRWGFFFKGPADLPCEGSQIDNVPCEYVPCGSECEPVNCRFSPWSDWAQPTCTQLCERHRTVARPSACEGHPCQGQLVETKRCIKSCQAPEDCAFSDWQDWSECQRATDQVERVRFIERPPSNGGQPCYGPIKETVSCSNADQVKDAAVDDWQEWSSCTVSCGGGTRTRARELKMLATPGGAPFSGPLQQLQPCQILPCPDAVNIPCLFGEWAPWGPCHENGLQVRRRKIAQQPHGRAAACQGALLEIQSCTRDVDCQLSPWSFWDDCDKTCGGGQQQRHREVMRGARNKGTPCPKELMETRGCATQTCHAQEGLVSEWSQWGPCSAECGPGQKQRTRTMLPHVQLDDFGFTGALSELDSCEGPEQDCKDCIDCVWGEWSAWSVCSNDCDGGQRIRKRSISQVPLPGCKLCEPLDSEEIEKCNTQPCHKFSCIDGLWGEWREWQPCSATCEGGVTWRSRPVLREANHCGKPAVGLSVQYGSCNSGVSCAVDQDCEFGEWREWGGCSQPCGGERSRYRPIRVKGRGTGSYCEGPLNQTAPCDGRPGCGGGDPTDCVMGGWSAWGECDVTCGNGQMMRRREVLVPGSRGGQLCVGDLVQTGPCILSPCEGTCEPRPCRWGDWEDWGACDQCNGQRKRFRHIMALAACGGQACDPGAAQETSNCTRHCHELSYCIWDDWQPFGACSASCGRGIKSRVRYLKSMPTLPARLLLDSSPLSELEAQQKFEELDQHTRQLETRRVQELVCAWVAGSLSLLAVTVSARSWLWATRSRPHGTAVATYEQVEGGSSRGLALASE